MNNEELKKKVNIAAYKALKERNYVSPVDVLIGSNVLSEKDYEDWRKGTVPYLEAVCKCNLKKLSLIQSELRAFARKNDLKPSQTVYNKWGKGKERLRFSKSGNANIERNYQTHFVSKRESDKGEKS